MSTSLPSQSAAVGSRHATAGGRAMPLQPPLNPQAKVGWFVTADLRRVCLFWDVAVSWYRQRADAEAKERRRGRHTHTQGVCQPTYVRLLPLVWAPRSRGRIQAAGCCVDPLCAGFGQEAGGFARMVWTVVGLRKGRARAAAVERWSFGRIVAGSKGGCCCGRAARATGGRDMGVGCVCCR